MANSKTTKGRIKRIWQGMKDRCYNSNHISYKNYGGRGILVCEEWFGSFDKFYLWSMVNGYKDDLTIDRHPNNDGNYEPNNCRWATMKQQAECRRIKKNSKITDPQIRLIEISKQFGIKYPTLSSRVQRGMSIEKAISYVDDRKNDARISKPILQYDMDGNFIAEYPSIKEITRVTSFKKPNIIHHLKGRQNRSHAYGFVWKYK